ncbi:MAG: PilW family protein [Salinisphaera sp.]|nr:PilW family protein [Salinisphaera sp.]
MIRPAAQSGMSLVELLIGLVISLLLLAGIVYSFLGQREASRAVRRLAALHTNGQAAARVINAMIGRAGYYPRGLRPASLAFRSGPAVSGKDGKSGKSDEITLRFVSDGQMSDCAGGAVPAGLVSINRLYVNDRSHSLVCQRTLTDNNGAPAHRADGSRIGSSYTALLEPAGALQITYGVDSDANGAVDRYLTANQVSDFTRVYSVRVQLRLGVPPHSLSRSKPAQTDPCCQGLEVDQVVALRNRLP